jgi:hypothetical protein
MTKNEPNEMNDFKGTALKSGTYAVLQRALKESLVEETLQTNMLNKNAEAERKALEFTEKMDGLDIRLRHGFQLIFQKLSI